MKYVKIQQHDFFRSRKIKAGECAKQREGIRMSKKTINFSIRNSNKNNTAVYIEKILN
jgi:hypothetical protein